MARGRGIDGGIEFQYPSSTISAKLRQMNCMQAVRKVVAFKSWANCSTCVGKRKDQSDQVDVPQPSTGSSERRTR